MNAIDEWLKSDGAQRDALKFKNVCDSFYIQNGSYDTRILANQLLNSTYGLAIGDDWAQRYLNVTDKLYDTLGIKDYLNKVYGNPALKFKNGSYIDYDINLTNYDKLKELFKAPDIVDLVNQIKREEENKMEITCSYTYNHNLTGEIIKSGDTYYVIGNYEVEPEDDYEGSDYVSKHLYAYKVPEVRDADKVVRIVKTRSREFLKENLRECRLCYYIYYGDDSIVIPGGFVFVNKKEEEDACSGGFVYTKKKKEETKDMSRNEILKNIAGSDIYIKKNNNIMYVGKGEDLDFVISVGDELSGRISFVADDEPLEDELRKISRSFIKKVIFNNPATIVFWRDGSKTIVKMNGKDKKFDPEKGLAIAIAKKCLGNKGNYYNTFAKFLPKEKAVKKSAKKGDKNE